MVAETEVQIQTEFSHCIGTKKKKKTQLIILHYIFYFRLRLMIGFSETESMTAAFAHVHP